MHACSGCNELDHRDRTWHGLYVAWYDHARDGHKIRARIFGHLADVLAH